jgi:predicted XRE-type DNA-binding protein
MADEMTVTLSSGNVFADLGFENPEEMEARALVGHLVASIIAQKKLTQSQAAELFGIKQPDVSKLMNGRLMGFSLERLFKFLTALRQDVEISVKPHRGSGSAKVKFVGKKAQRALAA